MGVIINGTNTKTQGFAIKGRPSIPSANKKIEKIEVEGRDGSLTRFLGYEDLKFSLAFNILFQKDIKQKLREIKGIISNATQLSFDDSPTFYYKVKQAQISDTETIIKSSGVFTVDFVAEPFEFEQANTTTYTSSATIVNRTTTTALPKITIFGTGTVVLRVNGVGITLTNLTNYIVLDSQIQEAYTGLTTNMNQNMNGEFPIFTIGNNSISWTGTVTKIEITTNWRWLT